MCLRRYSSPGGFLNCSSETGKLRLYRYDFEGNFGARTGSNQREEVLAVDWANPLGVLLWIIRTAGVISGNFQDSLIRLVGQEVVLHRQFVAHAVGWSGRVLRAWRAGLRN